MRYVNDPRQNRLFDVFQEIPSPLAYQDLLSGWQYLFRQMILELMPVGAVKEHFNPVIGQSTKELYSMCGLIFLMEFGVKSRSSSAELRAVQHAGEAVISRVPRRLNILTGRDCRYAKVLVKVAGPLQRG